MEINYEEIETFLGICNDLVGGKFVDADTKIGEALAAIAKSRELTNLFTAVTQGYDFTAAKKAFLIPPTNTMHGSISIPAERRELLAFVFCLFVEIDAGILPFSRFLLDYFFTGSYLIFADRVVRPFRDIVRDCYPESKRKGYEVKRRAREELFGQIGELIEAERARLNAYALLEVDRAASELLFAGLSNAVLSRDETVLSALLAGYKYFLHYVGGEDENSNRLFELAATL